MNSSSSPHHFSSYIPACDLSMTFPRQLLRNQPRGMAVTAVTWEALETHTHVHCASRIGQQHEIHSKSPHSKIWIQKSPVSAKWLAFQDATNLCASNQQNYKHEARDCQRLLFFFPLSRDSVHSMICWPFLGKINNKSIIKQQAS
jgi:hypothetical protein